MPPSESRSAFVTGGTGLLKTMGKHAYTNSVKAPRELGYRSVPLKGMVKDCCDWMIVEGRI
jgi:hypothetical protein